jgi:hypothetical protein
MVAMKVSVPAHEQTKTRVMVVECGWTPMSCRAAESFVKKATRDHYIVQAPRNSAVVAQKFKDDEARRSHAPSSLQAVSRLQRPPPLTATLAIGKHRKTMRVFSNCVLSSGNVRVFSATHGAISHSGSQPRP